MPPFSIHGQPGLTATKRSDLGRILGCAGTGIQALTSNGSNGEVASVLPRWPLAIHNWEMGMGISTVQAQQRAEVASLAAPSPRCCGPSYCPCLCTFAVHHQREEARS
nr:unnamed protein product [Digitaria exilis]